MKWLILLLLPLSLFAQWSTPVQVDVITGTIWTSEPLERVKLPASGAPAENTLDEFLVYDFDGGTDESVYATLNIPLTYNTMDSIQFCIDWSVDRLNPVDTTVVWGLEFKQITYGNRFNFGSGTVTELDTITMNGGLANSLRISTLDLSATAIAGSWQAADMLMFRIYRDADNGADTFFPDARVKGFYLRFKQKLGQ